MLPSQSLSGHPSTFCSDGVLLSFQGLDVSRLLHGVLALNGDWRLIIELFPCIQAGRPQQDHTHLEGWDSVFNLVSPSALRPGSRGQRGYVTETKRSLIPMAKTPELVSPLCSVSVVGWLGLCVHRPLSDGHRRLKLLPGSSLLSFHWPKQVI